jgi:hypothetical protein
MTASKQCYNRPMVYAVAILLVSSLTSVGLLAIWAAASRSHWFWRTMLLLGALAPLLLIPAYEPFIAFVLQGLVIAACVQLARWRAARKRGEPFFHSRFFLRTVLLAMVPVAVLVAVVVRLLEAKDVEWIPATQIGFVAGLTSLLGHWLARGELRLRWRAIIGAAFAIGFTIILQWNEWFVSQLGSFDFESDYNNWQLIPFWKNIYVAIFWLIIVVLVALSTALVLWLLTSHNKLQPSNLRAFATATLGLISCLLLAPCFLAFCLLINKLPIPHHELPVPNGYDDFLTATQIVPMRVIVFSNNFDPDTTSLHVIRKGIEEVQPAIDRYRIGLSKRYWKPQDYNSFSIESFNGFRNIGRGIRAVGKLAEREKDYSLAAKKYLELILLGHSIHRGGVLIDFLVGMPYTRMGSEALFHIRENVPLEDFAGIVTELAKIEDQIEPFENLNYRDRVHTESAFGWQIHLQQDLEESIFKVRSLDDDIRKIYLREIAYLRLLQVEFALRAWKAEHDDWPESLDHLVPDYLRTIPSDPFSPVCRPLKYQRTGEGYLLYSIGANGLDELGKVPELNAIGYGNLGTGDLRLDVEFAPEPATPPTGVNTANGSSNASSDDK